MPHSSYIRIHIRKQLEAIPLAQHPAPDTQLLLAAEVAELLRITEEHVYRMARRQELPCVRWGKFVRFDRNDIDNYIKAHRAA